MSNIKSKYMRKYNCPYCDYRGDRKSLVYHIEDQHELLITDEFPAPRIVFNLVNNKTDGKCVVCRGKSSWNNSSWRYDRICSERCKAEYIKDRDSRMMRVHNTTNLLTDPEHQKKMLANRSISGSYKFRDGGILTYTGSYEKQLLEFMDLVMEIPSKDIMTPGPVIEYEFEGKKLFWITDLLYIPFNLAFDVKDGGSNKNTHPDMQINRDKQIAKEKAIDKQNIYNYIRLTDNKFEQLMVMLLDIKSTLADTKTKGNKIVHINENIIKQLSCKDVCLENGSTHEDPVPVFIILTATGSKAAKVIKKFTNAPYNHSSISFDLNLDRIYSFGRGDKGNIGFGVESKDGAYLKRYDDVPFKILTVLMSKSKAKRMRFKLDEFLSREGKLKYNFLGLIGYLLNDPISMNDRMFCAEFVDSMFKEVDIDITNKPSGLVEPYDFDKSDSKNIFDVYEGTMKTYKKSEAEKTLKRIIEDNKSNINEAMIGTFSSNSEPYSYLISYSDSDNPKNIEGVGYIKNLMMNPIFVEIDNKIELKTKDFFKNKNYSIIQVENDENKYTEILNNTINEATIESGYLAKGFKKNNIIHSGSDLTKFDIVKDIKSLSKYREDMITRYSLGDDDLVILECNITNNLDIRDSEKLLNEYSSLIIKENHNGVFVKNINNGRRTGYYKSIKDIPKYILEILI